MRRMAAGKSGFLFSGDKSTSDAHVAVIPRAPKSDTARERLVQFGTWTPPSVAFQTFARNPSNASEWLAFAGLWDRFRVNAMRLRVFFPKYLAPAAASQIAGIGAIYDNDADPATFVLTPAAIVEYSEAVFSEGYGLFDFKIPSLPKGQLFTATVAGGTVASSEWTDCAQPLQLAGTILLSYLGVPHSASTVAFILEWDVTFQGRR